MSAAEEIEPISLRLRARSLAAYMNWFTSSFTQFFTKLRKKLQKSNCCWILVGAWQIQKKKFLLRLFLALVAASSSDG